MIRRLYRRTPRWASLLIIFLVFTLEVGQSAAQSADWEVIVLASAGADWRIVRITPEGLDAPISLPTGFLSDDSIIDEFEVSPDLHYAAVAARTSDYQTVFPVRIADLNAGVWIEFTPPQGTAETYTLSSFDSSSKRIAVSYASPDTNLESSYFGGFGVLDAASGNYTEQFTNPNFPRDAFSSVANGWVMLGEWDATGIRLHPSCYACEPPFEGEYSAWNPDTATYIPTTGDAFTIFGEQLAMTGELIVSSYSQDFPFSTEPAAYFPYPNILVYMPSSAYLPTFGSQSGEYEATPESPVIYANPDEVDLSEHRFEWVVDGQSILADVNNTWTLINRAGGSQLITPFSQADHIIGTPDGWIVIEPIGSDQSIVRQYTLDQTLVYENTLGTINSLDLRVLDATDLGESVSPVPAAFTAIQPDFAQLETVMLANQPVCPNFMPSRLFPGQHGQVTPGDANNIRINPTVTAEIVGQIPGGAFFDIVSGPECNDNTAWWYIRYNGQYGYTAEGMGSEYFVELVRPS